MADENKKKLKNQKVKFDYFLIKDKKTNKPCKISNFLMEIKNEKLSDREITLSGMPVRMDRIHERTFDKYGKITITYFHMVKLRDETLATTKEDTEELTDLEISSDDFIAEDISCIFDPEICTLMIQRNSHSVSPSSVRNYLTKMNRIIRSRKKDEKDKIEFDLLPVPNKEVLEKIKKVSKYRSITLEFAKNPIINKAPGILQKYLGPYGDIFNEVGGKKIGITISAGGAKEDDLVYSQARGMVDEILKDDSPFSKAIFRGSEGDEHVEVYDLMNGKLSDYYTFSSLKEEKDVHLDPSVVEEEMYNIYLKNNRKSDVIKNLS